MTARDLMRQYIFLHNYGIENADFEPLMQIFDDSIVFAFEDTRIGSFEGIDAVRRVFRLQPPVTPISIEEIDETEGRAVAGYADEANSAARLGAISIETDGRKITRIYISK